MKHQESLAWDRDIYATRHYNGRYDNHVYSKATQGRGNAYANALIDEALALCGSPFYKLSNRNWGKDAQAFLSLFVP